MSNKVKKVVLNRSITDTDSLSVLVVGTVYVYDEAPRVIRELFDAGDNRVSEFVKLTETDDESEDQVVEETPEAISPSLGSESDDGSAVEETTADTVSDDTVAEASGLDGIKGVGPKVKEKLNNAGVTTKEQLEALGQDELIKIVGPMVAKNIVV